MPDRPAAAVSEADGALIRPLSNADVPLVRDLHQHRENRVFAGTLEVTDDFASAVAATPWSTPMILERGDGPVALALVTAVDVHSRNGRLVVLAHNPAQAAEPLALYLRHVFWSHPLHRLYATLPAGLPQSADYVDLLSGCGFTSEGSLVAHLEWRNRVLDLAVLGLLRPELDAWIRDHHPAMAPL